ncbi:MAG: capsule assembly Wzi family protein [Gammaproteobacteria bacterium]|nr:capsule assembly Wzi family protein [Gammaproteobacteria bacterium]MDH3806396.1 capsule assembly Wzi family protein [Gammaproteobacteria bacterium]
MLRIIAIALILGTSTALAGPNIATGDLALRHDIQRLADHGVIKGTITTWPLAWGPILDDIDNADATDLPPAVVDALVRIRQRANWETRTQELTFNTEVGFADNATRIRSYQDTPRGRAEVSAGISWIDNWFSADINVQYVDSDQDDEDGRIDNSMIGVVAGNWSIAASTEERWWGPGWDGSLILSNNARPIPSLTIDRVFTDAFESKWLSWLGPWDLSVMFGQLEKERAVPDAQFFGMRFNFRPIPSLEIGLSRTAQWCGDDRPCDFDTFVDLLLGKDNIGDAGIGEENEPGNQLAGIDFRWAPGFFDVPVALYGQFIGEDEAGGFPSRYLGQLGLEGSGYAMDRWSFRWYVEVAATSCDFSKSNELFNCAYNHGIYQTGYRFRSRSIGHGADNDAKLISAGLIAVDAEDTQWRALLRSGKLNDGGSPDARHTLTATPQDVTSIDLSHSRAFSFGVVDIGVGYERIDDVASGGSVNEARGYLQWRSSY